MAPGGPRSRPGPSAPAPRPSATSRNEAFESIFGRPSAPHHMQQGGGGGSGPGHGPSAMGPGPPPGGGYGYAPHPSMRGGGGPGYLHPDQPSYPPGQVYQPAPPPSRGPMPYPQHGYQPGPPPPRSDSAMQYHRNAYDGVVDQHSRGPGGPSAGPPPQFSNTAQPGPPERRASVAPSTYSTSSTASYYSPNPDAISPPMPRTSRMPSGPHPPPPNSRPSEASSSSNGYPAERRPSGRGPPPPVMGGLSAAQAYQASTGYATSPSSVVFPDRAPGHSLQSDPHSTSVSPPLNRRPTNGAESRDRLASPPPDYLNSMAKMSFDGSGGGPLDNVPGIPKRGDLSDFGSFGPDFSVPSSSTSLPYQSNSHNPRQPSGSSMASMGAHRRMPSDASMTGSTYTMTSGGGGARQYMTPLSQIDSHVPAPDSPGLSPSTPTAMEGGFAYSAQRRMSSRKSMESTLSLPATNSMYDSPLPDELTPTGPYDNRATSFSGSSSTRREAMDSLGALSSSKTVGRNAPSTQSLPTPHPSQRSLTTLTRNSSQARAVTLQSMPHIYPALLSKVAEAFKQLISLSELIKDGITYKDSFDGRMAVGIIADIIKTPDRNLALLLGRALDAQKFFHDVTYDHRLRDNSNEVYQFKERLAAPFMNENGVNDSPSSEHMHLNLARHASSSSGQRNNSRPPAAPYTSDSALGSDSNVSASFASSANTPATSVTNLSSPRLQHKSNSGLATLPGLIGDDDADFEDDLPTGVFTLLTDCYSPTCSRDSLCYSINCPRRLEQMKRLNMKPQPGLTRKISHESIHDVKETGTLWSETVPKEIFDQCDDTEKKRQEAINEVIYTERDFVRDLEYLRDSWVKPLRSQEVVPSDRRDDFVRQVFWNVHEVLNVNQVLAERLTKRQKQQPVVQNIGDLFLERAPHFEPFVTYGAHQLFGKYEFEKEKGANPAFQKFVDETERKPESRKLELNGYLTKPTTRLGRYPLLLQAVLKYTPDDSPDKEILPEVIKMIKEYLTKVNIESGKSENIFELAQLDQQLEFRANEKIDLRLRDRNRELVHKGPLKRRGGSREEIADLMGFLFDHALLLVKPKWVNKAEQYRVYRRPIPLELLVIITPDDSYNSGKLSAGRARLMSRPNNTSGKSGALAHVPPKPESKHGFSITVIHLGKKGYSMQLWVDTYVSRKKWLEQIDKQQTILRERSCVFVTESITEGFFHGLRKINCISPYDNGNRLIYGTDEGVYFSNLRDEKLREPVKVISLVDVTQVDVIEDFQLLIVLHERTVTSFPLDCLDPNDPTAALKRGKKIASHTTFFKSGICLGKVLVAVVKSSTLSSTIKVFEAIDQTNRGKKPQASFMKRLNGANEALKLFKEFYIPTESSSIHFLKTKLCVGCTKGFEIVDLETLDMQGLLDPSDSSLDFVLKRDNVRPIAIYRIEEDFLLCYDEFAFYVNKNGWRSRPKWAIIWEGMPTAFALHYPYVVAFEPTFIEVHHVESGHLVQIIPSASIHCLFADTPPSRVNAPIPPNRQLNYGNAPPHMRPPPQFSNPGFQQQQQPQHGFRPPLQQHPGMRPPMGPGPYGMQPPPSQQQMPPQSRLTRNQVIFTSDDGHVQFLKFPPPSSMGVKRPIHGSRSSR